MNRKKKQITAAAMALGMMLCTGCSDMIIPKEHLPEETIEAFEDGMNEMDVQAMMDCIDEDALKAVTTGMNLAMKIAGKVSGVDLGLSAEDLINLMPLLKAVVGDYAIESGYPQVDFQVTKTYIKDDKATVYFTEAGSGETTMINMKKKDGKWYMVLDTKLITENEADRVIIAGQEEEQNGEEKREGTREYAEKSGDSAERSSFSILDLFDKEKIKDDLIEWLEE